MAWPITRYYVSEVFWCLRLIPWIAKKAHAAVIVLEPWGILLAVVALILSLLSFWIDYEDRVEERTVRAWQLLTTKAPGNSGKREALEYLNKQDGIWCFNGACKWPLKTRTSLEGIDLSVADGQMSAILRSVDLEDAALEGAVLRGVNLSSAILTRAHLLDADLRSADIITASLREAILVDADLSGALLHDVDLTRANLEGTDLSGTEFFRVSLEGTFFKNIKNASADLFDSTCGDENTVFEPEGPKIPMCSEVEWYQQIHGTSWYKELLGIH